MMKGKALAALASGEDNALERPQNGTQIKKSGRTEDA